MRHSANLRRDRRKSSGICRVIGRPGRPHPHYTYDANGNTISRFREAGDQASYQWDFDNRLRQAEVTSPGGSHYLQYQYDANNILVSQRTDGIETRLLIDANQTYAQVLEEYDPTGTTHLSYVYGLGRLSEERSGQRYFAHVDGLGSTRVVTDENGGNITSTYTYGAFGTLIEATGSTHSSYRFTGERFDEPPWGLIIYAQILSPGNGAIHVCGPV